ncbi:hypothetical protein, partial [Roseovarius sp.]|uniref:Flp family type IVb pilin n=1 Tax=Roseovarius sp. TaxID=1486281 RepID=UPI000C4C3A3F
MNKFINTFVKDEDGAVTVDWVVLTAAIVGLGIAGVAAVSDGVDELAGRISTGVQAVDVEGAPAAGAGAGAG